MDQRSVGAAETELRRAEEKLNFLREAEGFRGALQYWSEFLVAANRVYTKLEQGAKTGSSKGWFDEKKHHRRTDPLLAYILHARNADEHGIAEVAATHPASMTLVTVEGRKELPMTPGRHTGSFYGSPPKFGWLPPTVRIVPVTDRGKRYDPPSSHLGRRIENTGPLDIATLALEYLRSLVNEAKEQAIAGTR